MGVIIFNGISSEDYNIQVERPPRYEYPERAYVKVDVPGRNGAITIDTGSYKNVPRNYEIAVGSMTKDFTKMVNGISEWLHSTHEYARLQDSYESEYYRLAIYEESNVVENIMQHGGRAKIAFDCKPQRFFVFGDEPVIFTKTGILRNPTHSCVALPIITVHGTGSGVVKVGDYTVSISDIGGTLIINSEIQDVYYKTVNKNDNVTLSNNNFPKLEAGNNEVSFSGGITSVEVIPKWWTL